MWDKKRCADSVQGEGIASHEGDESVEPYSVSRVRTAIVLNGNTNSSRLKPNRKAVFAP